MKMFYHANNILMNGVLHLLQPHFLSQVKVTPALIVAVIIIDEKKHFFISF